MANVLEKIVNDKRTELERREQVLPLAQFKDSLTRSDKSLFAALAAPNAGFIFECKKASPSKGLIREPFDLDEILAAYTPYAAALSVLTDEKYFQGSYDYLAYVTERVAQPVLNKDFFISPYQVYLARYYKADAILLMLSVLSDEQYQELAAIAMELGLDILTEVSNAEEMTRAIALEANIIGINNRNLRDLSTDLATTEQLVPMLRDASHDFVVISESGIYTHQDVLRLAPYCDGFLVGSALMAQADLAAAVKQMVLGKIKVCGLTDAHMAKQLFDAGASYGGLIFAPRSPRAVTLEQACAITRQVPGNYVGVFVDAPVQEVVNTATEAGLSGVQLHGNEDADYRAQLRQQLPDAIQLWQAIGVTDTLPAALTELLQDSHLDKVVVDTKVGKQSGGTGQQFNWQLLDEIQNKHKLVLAGGINPDNINEAQATGVALVDVNSGVESAPGHKSIDKFQQLLARARQY